MKRIKVAVPDQHLQAIGLVTVNFALLENALAQLAVELLGVSRELGDAVTCELSFRNLVALVSSLYRERATDPRRIAACEQILTRAIDAEQKRNDIIHSLWLAGDAPDVAMRVKITAKKSRGVRYRSERVSLPQLESIAQVTAEVAADILDVVFWRTLPGPPDAKPSGVQHDA